VFGNRKVREQVQGENYKKIQEEETLKKLIKLSKMQYKENQTKEFVKKREQSIQVVSFCFLNIGIRLILE
jgi:2C-methyl-D-erythritol 2,4-cyclodiphosphate synthase